MLLHFLRSTDWRWNTTRCLGCLGKVLAGGRVRISCDEGFPWTAVGVAKINIAVCHANSLIVNEVKIFLGSPKNWNEAT